MSAYMGTMPWLILWLGIPWIGSGVTLLGNPNVLYSRRVLGWSVACFLALSAGLWWINPELLMTDLNYAGYAYDNDTKKAITQIFHYNTTRGTIIIGMIFSAIMFLFTWPDGKTAKGLALLGGVLGIMVGVRLGIPQWLYTQWRNVLNPSLFDFIRIVIPSLGGILWVMSIPYLTKKNTDAFDQAPLFEKFMYFMRWCLLFLPFIVFKTYSMDYSHTRGIDLKPEFLLYLVFYAALHYLLPFSIILLLTVLFITNTLFMKSVQQMEWLSVFSCYATVAIAVITMQSWRIPGFWSNVGMMHTPYIMYFVKDKYTYSPPLTSDKTALCPGALPEQIALWNPWSIMNRGMIWLFFGLTLSWTPLLWATVIQTYLNTTIQVMELDTVLYIKIGISLIMALHAYALFQPRFVPYRLLLWCSMVGLLIVSAVSDFMLQRLYSFFFHTDVFSVFFSKMDILSVRIEDLSILVLTPILFMMPIIILLPMVKAYKYRAILNPDGSDVSSTPALSRFWVLCLLGTSLSIGHYSLSTDQGLRIPIASVDRHDDVS